MGPDGDHEGHAVRRRPVVRGATRVAIAGDRLRGDGGNHADLGPWAPRRGGPGSTSCSPAVDARGHARRLPPVPLALRLPIAVVVVVVAAATDRKWLLPVAVTLSLPVLWFNGLAVLAACWPLRSAKAMGTRRAWSQRPVPVVTP